MKNRNKRKTFFIIIAAFIFPLISLAAFLFTKISLAAMEESEIVSVFATVPPNGTAIFSGKACPLCRVYVKINGVLSDSVLCQSNADFQTTIDNIATGTHLFEFYAIDTENIQTSILSSTNHISQGTITNISNILLSPTLQRNKSSVIKGEEIAFFGQTVPNKTVTIVIDDISPFIQVSSAQDGGFYYIFNSSSLELGSHSVKARVGSGGNFSLYSLPVSFSVEEEDVEEEEEEEDVEEDEEEEDSECSLTADYNCDKRVNLTDFSILMYWFEKGKFPSKIDLNDDNKVNILEFSIMMHYWTG